MKKWDGYKSSFGANKLTLPSQLLPQVDHDILDPGKAVNNKPILEIFVQGDPKRL